jgi:sulfate/thiosulfate transport system substrate-binding protein
MPERANACAAGYPKGEALRQQVYLELRRAIEEGTFAPGTRGSSITFAQRNQGDVFISWENEAYLLEKEFGNKVDFVYPSISILAQPAVTLVDKNVDKKGTRAVAEEYLKHLYSQEAQDIIGKHFYRPTSAKAQAKYAKQLPKLKLFTIDEAFGGWDKAAKDHFADGASFDQLYSKK